MLFAATVLALAGLGIAAFAISLPMTDVPVGGGLVGLNSNWIWATFFIVVGAIHLTAGLGVAGGRQWSRWLGLIIGFAGAVLGAYLLARSLSHFIRYMDVTGTIGLAVVTALYAVAGWSLFSSRQWYAHRTLPMTGTTTEKKT